MAPPSSPSSSDPGQPLVVLGMHRSGTSLLTALCARLGLRLGERLLPARGDNPRGFWEHEELVELNEGVFRLFGLNSQDVLPFPHGWLDHSGLPELRERLLEVLRRDLVGPGLWGVKDPRIGRLLPLWLGLFEALGATPRFVIPFRHPAEVARSLVRRDYVSFERGVLLWLQYNLEIEHHTRPYRRLFTDFEQVLRAPVSLAHRIEGSLGIEFPKRPEAATEELEAFVDPTLRHHDARREDTPLPAMAREAHAGLSRLAAGDTDAEAALDALRADLWALLAPGAETLYALHPPAGIWRQTVEAKQREIETLREELQRHRRGSA